MAAPERTIRSGNVTRRRPRTLLSLQRRCDDRRMTNPNKALWEKGDFGRIADTMRESGEAFVESIGVAEGMDVVDVGSGDGTTAVPSAQRGANVVGVDISEPLVAAGNARAKALGLSNLRF